MQHFQTHRCWCQFRNGISRAGLTSFNGQTPMTTNDPFEGSHTWSGFQVVVFFFVQDNSHCVYLLAGKTAYLVYRMGDPLSMLICSCLQCFITSSVQHATIKEHWPVFKGCCLELSQQLLKDPAVFKRCIVTPSSVTYHLFDKLQILLMETLAVLFYYFCIYQIKQECFPCLSPLR